MIKKMMTQPVQGTSYYFGTAPEIILEQHRGSMPGWYLLIEFKINKQIEIVPSSTRALP